MIKFNFINDTYKFDFDESSVISLITNEIVKELHIEDDHVVSFIIVDNKTIHEINKSYRNVDRPTDVISFANIDSCSDGEIPFELGDIYISYEKVISQSNDYNHSIYREFSFLVTHGMLHLLGYDHMVKEDEVKMFNLQDIILNNLNILR